MTDKHATALCFAAIAVIAAIMFTGVFIAKHLDSVASAVSTQTQKCMLGDDR